MKLDGVTRFLSRSALKAQKNSPHILLAVGIGGIIVSTVMACRATLKLDKRLDEFKADLDSVKELREDSKKEGRPYTDQDYFKDLGYVYTKNVSKLTILYGPPIIIGTISLGLITGSHVQLSRRNEALTVTLAAVTKAYDSYRLRVQEELGKEKELELYRDVHKQVIDVEGKEKAIEVSNPGKYSIYARAFTEDNSCYQRNNQEYNRMFLQVQQNYYNEQLRMRGHVFLNEVYDNLGFDRSPAGALVGWIYKSENGDGYIDFGLEEEVNHIQNASYMEIRPGYILDFNVDGVIYNLI
jgi:Family of unknown function (DUF6353)